MCNCVCTSAEDGMAFGKWRVSARTCQKGPQSSGSRGGNCLRGRVCVCVNGRGECVCRGRAGVVSSVWTSSASRLTQSDGAGSYHVRVGLQHKASLFPPLLSVVVLKHITQTLKHKLQVRRGGWVGGWVLPQRVKPSQNQDSMCMERGL